MKGLSRNVAISSRSSTEMHLFVMHYGTKALKNFCKISIPANYRNDFGVNL